MAKDNYKEGVPQQSILGPLLFFIFNNCIADETIGLCRLFADDTSIGEKSYEINSLCNMVNTDLKHISEWSKQWLVKLNPTKTDIVYFNTRDIPPGLFFWIENTRIYPEKCHKHLSITLSADCKWSNHIHTIIEKTSKQVAVLRKLKFKVSRNFLETMYLTFIRPLLEYAGEVWDNCTLADSERLEQIQLEAARIVTGLTSYASLLSLYKETGWEKLSVRREKRKLSLFYDIVSG
jgi:hypothetical protein